MKRAVLAAISLIILIVLAYGVNWQELMQTLRAGRPFPLLMAFLLTLLFPVFNTLRWLCLLHGVGIRMSFWKAFRITMACWPVGTLTPAKAGEFLKAAAVPNRSLGLGTTIAERVIDIAVLGVYGLVFGAIIGSGWAVLGGLAGVSGAAAVVLLAGIAEGLVGKGKLAEKLRGFLSVRPLLLRRPKYLWACVLASAANWFLSMAQLAFLLEAFGQQISWTLIIGILPAATFIGLLPITLAGIGTRDSALLFLSLGRIDGAAMLASSIIYTFLGYFMLGAMGLPFLSALTETPSNQRRNPRP